MTLYDYAPIDREQGDGWEVRAWPRGTNGTPDHVADTWDEESARHIVMALRYREDAGLGYWK